LKPQAELFKITRCYINNTHREYSRKFRALDYIFIDTCMLMYVTVDSSSGDILLSWIAHLVASLVILDTSFGGLLISWIPHLVTSLVNWIAHLVSSLVILDTSSGDIFLSWISHTELHTPVWYIVGMRTTSRIEIKMSSLCIVVTFFLNWC
jgi:hypothetical protein